MSLAIETMLIGGVALELVGAGVLAHAHNAESIVELRDEVGEEGTALGESDAVATHATLLAEKRIGFVLLTVGLLLSLAGLVADSTEHTLVVGGIAAAALILGIMATVVITPVLGNRYQARARVAAHSGDEENLPEQ